MFLKGLQGGSCFFGLTECAWNYFVTVIVWIIFLERYVCFLSKSPHPPHTTQKCNYPPPIKNGFNLIRERCTSCYIVETLTCDYNTLFVVGLTQCFSFVPVETNHFLKSPLAGTKWKHCVRPVTNSVLSQETLNTLTTTSGPSFFIIEALTFCTLDSGDGNCFTFTLGKLCGEDKWSQAQQTSHWWWNNGS